MALPSKITKLPLEKIIRVSERIIRPGKEHLIKNIMDGAEPQVRKWPGLISMETLVDRDNAFRFVVITEWEDKASLNRWQKSEVCNGIKEELEKVLEDGEPVKYRELKHHEDNVFLL